MSGFGGHPERSIDLPPGCKDLIDAKEMRNWKKSTRRDWPKAVKYELAYMDRYLAQLLQLAGSSYLLSVSGHLDLGLIMVIEDTKLTRSVVSARWKGMAEKKAVRAVFEEAGFSSISGPVGRLKIGRSLNYPLPTDAAAAAWLIGNVFRTGYGLRDASQIILLYHKIKTR